MAQLTPPQASKLFHTLLRLKLKNCSQQKVSSNPRSYFHNLTMFVFMLHTYRNIKVNREKQAMVFQKSCVRATSSYASFLPED